jgi:hypothetical protein
MMQSWADYEKLLRSEHSRIDGLTISTDSDYCW